MFGALVAVVSTLLMAPQTNEFGAKVGLLAGLVLLCAARPLMERIFPGHEPRPIPPRAFAQRVATGGRDKVSGARVGAALALGLVAVLFVSTGIVVAGTAARGVIVPDVTEVLNRVPHPVDPATLPVISIAEGTGNFDPGLLGPEPQQLVVTLGQNLQLENEALRRHDDSILVAVDHGDRLDEMRAKLQESDRDGPDSAIDLQVRHHQNVPASAIRAPGRPQPGHGFPRNGDRRDLRRIGGTPIALVRAVRKDLRDPTRDGGRWLNVAVLPPQAGG